MALAVSVPEKQILGPISLDAPGCPDLRVQFAMKLKFSYGPKRGQ